MIERNCLDTAAQNHCRIGQLLHALHFDVVQNTGGNSRFGAHGTSHLDHHLAHFSHVLTICHTNINQSVSIVARFIGDDADLPVRHIMHAAFIVAQAHITQRDVFHHAYFFTHLDDIALADLIFQQQEKAIEIILDEALRTKAHG